MRINIYDTYFSKHYLGLESQVKRALRFMSENYKFLTLNEREQEGLMAVKSFNRTPFSEIFEQVKDQKKLDNLFFYTTNHLDSDTYIPEILAIPGLVLNPKPLKDSIMSELYRPWINISSMLAQERKINGRTWITDTPTLYSLTARGLLGMSYDDTSSAVWINVKMAGYLTKTFALIYGGLLNRYCQLNEQEFTIVRILLGLYFAQRCIDNNSDATRPAPLFKERIFGNNISILEIINEIYNNTDKKGMLELEDLPVILKNTIQYKFKNIDIQVLIKHFLTLTTNIAAYESIGIEYPPYWAHQVGSALSGTRNFIAIQLKNYKLKDEGIRLFSELLRNKSFIEGE